MKSKQPNMIFILTDQQRADTMSAYGGKVCRTPHLDQLTQDSVVYSQAYCTSPICTPARASLQTGVYPSRHGMMTNMRQPGCMVHELPDTPDLLSRRLQQQDYNIGLTGKWHVGQNSSLPSALGYEADDFGGHGVGGHSYPLYLQYLQDKGLKAESVNRISGNYEGHYAAEFVSPVEATVDYFLVDRALHYIDQFSRQEKPFFFMLNFWGPHEPYIAPSKHLDLYRNVQLEPWPNFYDQGDRKPAIHKLKRAQSREWEAFEPYVRHYYAFMSSIDEQIGRLLDELKRRGLYDDAVIIFSTDHGESLGIHGGLSDKSIFMYEETCRIPLLIKWPQQERAGATEQHLVNTCDIYSTILDCAGVSPERAERDGRSLVPLLKQEPDALEAWPDVVVTEGSGIGHVLFTQRMIRQGHMKYVFNCGDIDELYDLFLDPYEMVNVIDDLRYQEQLQALREALVTWLEQHRQEGLAQQFRMLRMRE